MRDHSEACGLDPCRYCPVHERHHPVADMVTFCLERV